MDLRAGRTVLRIRATAIPAGSAMDLDGLRLTRLGAAAVKPKR